MLAGPKRPFPAQMSRPGRDRAIADNWRGLYGSDRFSSMLRGAAIGAGGGPFETAQLARNIMRFGGVFEDATRRTLQALARSCAPGTGTTLSNCNLTGSGRKSHPRTAEASKAKISCQRPRPADIRKSRGMPSRRLGLSGKLLLLTIPLVMIAGMLIYVPAIANFRMNRLNDRLAAANTAALVLDAAPSGMVPDSLARQDPRQHRRACGCHQDGAAAPAVGQRRFAGGDRPRRRHADDDGMVGDRRFLRNHARERQPDHPRDRAGARRRAVHRDRVDEAPLRASMYRFSRNLLLVAMAIAMFTAGAGLYRPAFPVRAADAAADREPGRLPREPGKLGADHRAQPARRRDRRRRARIVRHAARPGVDAASEEPARRPWPCGVEDQPRSAQSARRPRNCCRISLPACPIRGCSGSRRN